MIRTKWLKISTDLSVVTLGEELSKRQIRRGATVGFELSEVQKKSIRGRFIEEIVDNELVVDPFGQEIIHTITRYAVFEFYIVATARRSFLMRVSNPPRSLKSFVSALGEAFGFGFSIDPIELDILALTKYLRRATTARACKIKKARVGAVRLSQSAIARIDVQSSEDAYGELQNVFDLRNSFLERATIELSAEGLNGQLELSSTGLIACQPDLLENLSPLLQNFFSGAPTD